MSYTLTTRFGIAHGHAVALCLPIVWEHLINNGKVPKSLSQTKYKDFMARLNKLEMDYDFQCDGEAANKLANELACTVNLERLNNHPLNLSKSDLVKMYHSILE